MFRASAILVVAMTISTICVGFSGGAWAQTALTPDTFQVNYFSNANTSGAPDQTVRITNPGQQGDTAAGTLCANIYVFNTKEELDECCSCPITPNGLQTFSVNTNLTSNPLSGPKPTDGVIKIVSGAASSGACPNQGTSVTLLPALRAWSTHTQKTSSSL